MEDVHKFLPVLAGLMILLSLWAIQNDRSTVLQFSTLAIGVILFGFAGYNRYKKN